MKDENRASEVTVNPVKNPAIETFDLPNGLKVFMVVDKSAPLVAVDINYHVGSRNERPGKTGFAHLFEHMMFQGSKHYDDDYFKPLQDVGGQVNGATSTDRMPLLEIVPSAWLERALWLESDRMAYLLDAMTQERLDNQKSVVSNERRQNYDNRPYGTVWEKMAAALTRPSTHIPGLRSVRSPISTQRPARTWPSSSRPGTRRTTQRSPSSATLTFRPRRSL